MPKPKPSAASTATSLATVPLELIQSRITVIRGMRVMLDADLAAFYGVPTSRFNEAVKRHADRFPQEDFRFQLTGEEAAHLMSQSATSSSEASNAKRTLTNTSPRPMSSRGTHGGLRKLPWAFTEHGELWRRRA